MEDQKNDDQQNDVDRAARHEELRFAKKQQWYVATSAVTLLAAIFAIARGTSLSVDERGVVTFFIFLIATFGIDVLSKLQTHMWKTRQEQVCQKRQELEVCQKNRWRGTVSRMFFSCSRASLLSRLQRFLISCGFLT